MKIQNATLADRKLIVQIVDRIFNEKLDQDQSRLERQALRDLEHAAAFVPVMDNTVDHPSVQPR